MKHYHGRQAILRAARAVVDTLWDCDEWKFIYFPDGIDAIRLASSLSIITDKQWTVCKSTRGFSVVPITEVE